MKNQLIDVVLSEDVVSLARIIEDLGTSVKVQILNKNHGGIYIFDEEEEHVPKEAICGYYDTDDLEKTGLYIRTRFGYEQVSESDSDYEPNEDDDDDESCDSLSLSVEENDDE
jgi:hypothetical protein